jgi:PPK2 family polyphosphate:nucleotide phosphotransferase
MSKLSKLFAVTPGKKVHLSETPTNFTAGYKHKKAAAGALAESVQRLDELQYLLYAEHKRALLVVLQGMDASGKDGTIRHVMSGINPQGCRVTAFKEPTSEELSHDYLWRIHKAVPPRGTIGLFNRSHYEDVLVVRVQNLVPKAVWSRRYEQINEFEHSLRESGVHILKFFLHISPEEQLARFRERLKDPRKQWKISPEDFKQRRFWKEYAAAYEDALTLCSTEWAPWHVIPSDHKWFRNLAVARIITETLEGLDMKLPKPSFDVSKIKVV